MSVSFFPNYKVAILDEFQAITPAQVKARLRIATSDLTLDDQIPELIRAARQYVERYTKCILYSARSIEQRFDEWPQDRILRLAFFPLNENLSPPEVAYYDGNGNLQNITGFQVDYISFPHRIYFPDSITLPALAPGVGKISVTGLYGADVTSQMIAPLVQCIYMLIQAWLENGSDFDISDMKFVHSILDQYTAS